MCLERMNHHLFYVVLQSMVRMRIIHIGRQYLYRNNVLKNLIHKEIIPLEFIIPSRSE